MASKPTFQVSNLPSFAAASPTPHSPRKLRKFQSHQTLTSTSYSAFSQQPSLAPAQNGTTNRSRDSASTEPSKDAHQQLGQNEPSARTKTARRGRSNSDAASSLVTPTTTAPRPRRPARKTGSSGFSIRRSGLEALLRDGPTDGKLPEALQELRLLVLSSRVDADGDGMVRALGKLLNIRGRLTPPSLHIEYTCG
jgi:cell cycle arrest protein BUB2